MRICSFSGCGRRHDSRGFCMTHARRHRNGRSLAPILVRSRDLIPSRDIPGALLVPLNQGKFAIIDQADGAEVGALTWTLKVNQKGRSLYAQRTSRVDGKTVSTRLHRFLWEKWGLPTVPEIDHINLNGLDCRRSNLRAATRTQNNANTGLRRDNQSGVKGVSRCARTDSWQVHIAIGGESRYLGRFADLAAAGDAYKRAAEELFGEFARTSS